MEIIHLILSFRCAIYAVCFQSFVVVYPSSLCYFIVAYLFIRFCVILEGLPVSSYKYGAS